MYASWESNHWRNCIAPNCHTSALTLSKACIFLLYPYDTMGVLLISLNGNDANKLCFVYFSLETPSLMSSGQICVSFYYHMYENPDFQQMGTLTVYRNRVSSGDSSIFSREGNQGNQWIRAQINTEIIQTDRVGVLIFSNTSRQSVCCFGGFYVLTDGLKTDRCNRQMHLACLIGDLFDTNVTLNIFTIKHTLYGQNVPFTFYSRHQLIQSNIIDHSILIFHILQ